MPLYHVVPPWVVRAASLGSWSQHLSWRRSARTHLSAACNCGARGADGARSPAAPPLPGRAATGTSATASPGPNLLASMRADAAPVLKTEQLSCGASQPAHSKPPTSWAAKLTGSMGAAGPAAVAAVAVPGTAAVSYARAVSPIATADAPVVHDRAAARAADHGVNELGESSSREDSRPSRGASPAGCRRPEQQVCSCATLHSPLLMLYKTPSFHAGTNSTSGTSSEHSCRAYIEPLCAGACVPQRRYSAPVSPGSCTRSAGCRAC